ncbi:O-antigen ligase family protein [Chloroflexota bacterium]
MKDYLENLTTRVKSLRVIDLIVLLVGLAAICFWSDAATRLPVFTFGGLIRVLSPPLAATLLLVIFLIARAADFPLLSVSIPKLRDNLPFILVIFASCLLLPVGVIAILNQFELPLALPMTLAFTALLAVLVFAVTKIENALLTFFLILPILGMISLDLRISLHMKGSVLILPTDFLGIPLRSSPVGIFNISGMEHFAAMPPEVLFIGVIGLGFLLTMLNNRTKWVRTPLDWFILGFVVICLISSCFSSDVALSMSYVVEGILIPILLYYVIVNVVRTPAQLHKMLAAMFFLAVSGGIYQLYRIYEATGFSMTALSNQWWIARGSPVSSDIYAGVSVLVLMMPVALVLCMAKGQWLWLRALAFAAVFLGYTQILFTFRRGDWLAALVQIVILIVIVSRVRRLAIVLSPLVMLWLFFDGFGVVEEILGMWPRAPLEFTSLGSSILIRFWTWGESFKLMIAHPLTGIGLGTFTSAFLLYEGWLWMRGAHHLFLSIGAEAGVIALLFFIAILVVVLKEGVLLMRSLEDTYPKNLVLGLVIGVAGYIIVGVSTGIYLAVDHFILPTVMLWGLIGLIVAHRNYSHRQI